MVTSVRRLLWLLLVLTLPAVVHAQFYYTVNNGAVTITGYFGPGGAVTIPATINVGGVDRPVTTIGGYAFQYATTLTGVTIPNSVTNLGIYAFLNCTSLGSIAIPNSVIAIGDDAFIYCSSLTNVTIGNGVISIGNYAFDYCAGLTNIMIGNSLTNILDGAFYNCGSLTGIYFKGNAPNLGSAVFTGDNSATVYYLPATTGWTATFGGLPTAPWTAQVQTNRANLGVQTNRFGFTITGTSNLVIVVEASTNLASPIWAPVGTNTLTGGLSYFSDPQWTNYPARFYRLRSP